MKNKLLLLIILLCGCSKVESGDVWIDARYYNYYNGFETNRWIIIRKKEVLEVIGEHVKSRDTVIYDDDVPRIRTNINDIFSFKFDAKQIKDCSDK